jgi:membrane protease YdiL (CAAX protease family)
MKLVNLLNRIQNLKAIEYTLFLFLLILLSSVISALIVFVFSHFNIELGSNDKPLKGSQTGISVFLLACVVAPIFETFIAQMLPISFFKKYFNSTVVIILSAAFFGLLHWYNIAYMINTFFIGLVLAWGYIFWTKENIIHPFWIICTVHSLKNLLAFILAMYFP